MTVEVGWLCVGGVEVINDARTMSYLYRGLAGPNMAGSVATDTARVLTGMVEAPYDDEYEDPYGELLTVDCGDGFATPCLMCACKALTFGEDYMDPETDDAPWFQTSASASAEFLGVTAVTMDLTTPTLRSQTPRTRFGGTPTPPRLLPRVLQVQARLYASTAAGMEWGKRWLTDVLVGACDGTQDATFLPYCPDENQDADTVYRMLADCVLVDGPTFVEVGSFPGFRVLDVRFQLGSSAPWLMGVPTECDSGILTAGSSRSCLIETEDWGGGVAIRLTLSGRFNDVTVRAVPLAEDQDCPVVGYGMACSEFAVSGTQNGDILTIDSARRDATLWDVTSKNDVSAIPYLEFDGPFPWIEAGPCTRLCVTVHNGGPGTAQVTVETVLREL